MKSLKEILHDIGAIFHKLFNSLPKWVIETMPHILAVTNSIKQALSKGEDWLKSQTADTILALIPGDKDDEIRKWLVAVLDKALPLIDSLITEEHSLDEKLKLFLASLAKETSKGVNTKLIGLAQTMLKIKDESRLPEDTYDSLGQLAYSKLQGQLTKP